MTESQIEGPEAGLRCSRRFAHAAPETRLPFPFSQRWALALWHLAFAPSKPFSADPKRDAQ
jgi:hypothetical protein